MNYLDIDFEDTEKDYYFSKKEKMVNKNKKSEHDGVKFINKKNNNKHRQNNKRMINDFFN